MKVIICGAGQVGHNIARSLVREENDITVIDIDGERLRVLCFPLACASPSLTPAATAAALPPPP